MKRLTASFAQLFATRFAAAVLLASSLSSLAQAQTWSTRDTTVTMNCGTAIPDYTFDAKAGYTPGNAFMALLAATIAENWTDAGIRKDLAAFGFTNVQLIGKILAGSYGYIAESKDVRILAFRGTHSIHEGLIDLTAATVSYADVGFEGEGHAGMKLSFKTLWAQINGELAARQKANPKPIIVVGHSLGGSIAMLHAMKLKQLGYPVQALYTAAQPRVGDATLMAQTERLLGDRYYRMENETDPVPHLPPTAANAVGFANVFAEPNTVKYDGIITTVENLNYSPLPGWTVELTADGFKGFAGVPAELESELNFQEKFKGEVDASEAKLDLATQIAKHVIAHIGDSYICGYLKLLAKGYAPVVPN